MSLHEVRSLAVGEVVVREVLATGAATVAAHAHACDHLTFVQRGRVIDRSAKFVAELSDGDVLLRPRGLEHANVVAGEGSRGLIIESAAPILRGSRVARDSALRLCGNRLLAEIGRKDEVSHLIVRGLALQMIGLAVRSRGDAAPTLQPLLEHLDRHLTLPPTTEQAAAILGHDAVGLERLLRKEGTSLARLVRERRLHCATTLLEGSLPIAEIALLCGFYDQPHFTRVFRAVYAMTPGDYRRSASTRRRSIMNVSGKRSDTRT
jgi:AraC-like DNA-binding protein